MYFYELKGAAIAFGIRVLADFVVLEWLAGSLAVNALVFAVPAVLVATGFFIANVFAIFGLPWFVTTGLLCTALLMWMWLATPEQMRAWVLSHSRGQSFAARLP